VLFSKACLALPGLKGGDSITSDERGEMNEENEDRVFFRYFTAGGNAKGEFGTYSRSRRISIIENH